MTHATVKKLFRDDYNIRMDDSTTTAKRSAGRPRAFDRDKALRIALDLFWRHGFEGTSTAQLTQAMGISPPSLYSAFGAKDALFREAVALYRAEYGRALAEPLERPGSARDAIEAALMVAAKQFSEPSHALGCIIAGGELQASPENAELVAEMSCLRKTAQKAIQSRLQAAQTTGELAADVDTVALAAYFAMVVQGMAVQARDGAKVQLLKRLAALAMRAWPA